MRDRGYVEGQNLDLQRRSLEGKAELGPEVMGDLVRRKVDVIVAGANPSIAAAKRATATIPIVMVGSVDPLGAGFIASFARPGGNITGTTSDAGMEVMGKQLQLLHEALPHVRRVAYVGTKPDWASERGRSAQAAARALGLTLVLAENTPGDYTRAFTAIAREHAEAFITSPTGDHFTHRSRLAEAALKNRVPSMSFSVPRKSFFCAWTPAGNPAAAARPPAARRNFRLGSLLLIQRSQVSHDILYLFGREQGLAPKRGGHPAQSFGPIVRRHDGRRVQLARIHDALAQLRLGPSRFYCAVCSMGNAVFLASPPQLRISGLKTSVFWIGIEPPSRAWRPYTRDLNSPA